MTGLLVVQPGMLSLLQDEGRFGQHRIGLTNGGPLDRLAMLWANRLVHNTAARTVLEVSFGGLELEAQVDTLVALTGGDAPFSINGEQKGCWRSHHVLAGDRISIGYAQNYCRSYLAVHAGFQITPSFGSSATVPREAIGGLNGGKLEPGDLLPCPAAVNLQCLQLKHTERPHYSKHIQVRVIPGYQDHQFTRLQQRRFFSGNYTVTDRADRMGYRLQGPAIKCGIEGILSEGICAGAIQIPADGQPIVLLNDRQTIGGYPKIGAALSLDTARMAQLMPGSTVTFEPISPYAAHNALHLAASRFQNCQPEECAP
jgi:biotin-dependent carboxylase-like uncharacterized protein